MYKIIGIVALVLLALAGGSQYSSQETLTDEPLPGSNRLCEPIQLTANGKFATLNYGKFIEIVDIEKPDARRRIQIDSILQSIHEPNGNMRIEAKRVTLHPGGNLIAIITHLGPTPGYTAFFDLERECVVRYDLARYSHIAFSSDGKWMAAIIDGKSSIWSMSDSKLIHPVFVTNARSFFKPKFNSESTLCVVGCEHTGNEQAYTDLQVLDLKNPFQPLHRIQIMGGNVSRCVFSGDSAEIMYQHGAELIHSSISSDVLPGSIKPITVRGGLIDVQFVGDDKNVITLSYEQKSNRLQWESIAALWELGDEDKRFELFSRQGRRPQRIELNRSGTHALFTSEILRDDGIKLVEYSLYDVNSRSFVWEKTTGPLEPVYVVFCPDGLHFLLIEGPEAETIDIKAINNQR